MSTTKDKVEWKKMQSCHRLTQSKSCVQKGTWSRLHIHRTIRETHAVRLHVIPLVREMRMVRRIGVRVLLAVFWLITGRRCT
ncbi:hypothetical protein KIN20_000383, partial [Parelaphostrongylus tenuis]